MVLQLDEFRARQFVGAVEINLAGEDAVELRRVGALDGEHGVIERLAEGERRHGPGFRSGGDDFPRRVRRHDEGQRLLLHRRIVGQFVADLPRQIADRLLEDVADALEEKQREDVAAKLGVIDIAAQDVGGFFEEGVQLRLGHAAKRDGDGGWRRHEGRELKRRRTMDARHLTLNLNAPGAIFPQTPRTVCASKKCYGTLLIVFPMVV